MINTSLIKMASVMLVQILKSQVMTKTHVSIEHVHMVLLKELMKKAIVSNVKIINLDKKILQFASSLNANLNKEFSKMVS